MDNKNTNANAKSANDKATDKKSSNNRTEFADEMDCVDSTNKKSGNR